MEKLKIKVCGLTQLDQIIELLEIKINFLGFIFYDKSPRNVLNNLTLEEINSISSNSKIGVFVNETIGKIIEISEKAGLNYIQLHGDESQDYIKELTSKLNDKIGIIKVIRIGNQTKEELQKDISNQPSSINYFLFDTDSQAYGGTGKSFDWQILNELNIEKPYFLSGGISEDKIKNLKWLANKPHALDINSKFEIEAGNKNLNKIKEFKNIIDNEFSKI